MGRGRYIGGVRSASPLPDHVLAEIDRFARRLRRPRSTLWAEAVTESVRRVGRAIVDALDGAARGPVIPPP